MSGGNVPDGPSVKSLLQVAVAAGIPRLDAELLIAAATGLSRALLLARDDDVPDREVVARVRERLARRAAGEPLAYIEGRREFWSLELAVSPDVLVPRPETELLVEATLERLDAGVREVVDLGTGSGAIALALAHERPRWQVIGTDASAAALGVATANASRLGLANLRFLSGHWCAPLEGLCFDAIVSNPPYIAVGDPALPALRFEPQHALVADDGGFSDLMTLVRQAPDCLKPGGWLLLEHGSTQAGRVATALTARGFQHVSTLADLAGHERVTLGQWPGASRSRVP